MTEPREAASALPLSVTCSPDDRFADAVRALVGRVGALAGDPGRAEPFVAAIDRLVAWVLAHRATVSGDVALAFEREGNDLVGRVQWPAAGHPPAMPDAQSLSLPGAEVQCDVHGAAVRCRVTCRCG